MKSVKLAMQRQPLPNGRQRVRFIGLFALLLVIGAGLFIIGLSWHSQPGSSTAASSAAKQQAKAGVAVVEITSSGFVPNTLSVAPNTKVVWVNEDVMPHLPAADPYPSHSSMPTLVAPRALGQKETYSFLFTKSGTVHYHDDLNPTVNGEIVIRK